MSTWLEGDINALVLEGRAIQQRVQGRRVKDENETITKSFTRLMRKGNIRSALRLLSKFQGTPLSVNQPATSDDGKTVLDVLREKHPPACDVSDEILQDVSDEHFHPVVFESIDCEAIRKSALRTEGSAGPSGIDARGFRRMCTSFGKASNDLCWSMSCVAKRIASSYMDPKTLNAFTVC